MKVTDIIKGVKPSLSFEVFPPKTTEQIIDLYANGVNAVHVYSINKPDIARTIQNNVSEIIK